MNKFDLQFFAAAENTTITTDIEPVISIDFTSRIAENLDKLRQVLGITDMIPMAQGSQIKIYKTVRENTPEQVGEGEEIPLTKITRKLANTIELKLNKYRKNVTAEAIQSRGRQRAVNETDSKLVSEIQKDIKKDFFTLLGTGSASATGTDLQTALANSWAKLQEIFEDEDADNVYFVNPTDLAKYLGDKIITTEQTFGLTYVQNFLGLGTVIVDPRVTATKVYATSKQNLNGAYVPASGGDVATTFSLTSDSTGLVGMTHTANTSNATLESLIFTGVKFFPERLDGIVVATIAGE